LKKTYRYRLPEGFVALKSTVGELLRDAREASFDYGEMPRREFAQLVGISRETLSRIENGARWPSYSTLVEIMGVLSIEWSQIAIKGTSSKTPIRETPEVCCQLGEALRAGRKSAKLNLRQLAEHTGTSAAQLSRIENGLFVRGGHIEIVPGEGNTTFDDCTIVRFTHPVLEYLAELGGYDSDIGRRLHSD
tara:strand:+ start:351 stop:923 length:573 start_codon:yes stop_codon:yes gene_type:complete